MTPARGVPGPVAGRGPRPLTVARRSSEEDGR